MNYKEYKDARQEEFNKLPIFWAFSNKQFEEALAERGIALEDAPKMVYKLGHGGFYLKSDAEQIRAYMAVDQDAELRKLMASDLDFARDAFEYEMFNHEYPINWQGDWDVASCFGSVEYSEEKSGADYLRELGFGDDVIRIWNEARGKVQTSMEW